MLLYTQINLHTSIIIASPKPDAIFQKLRAGVVPGRDTVTLPTKDFLISMATIVIGIYLRLATMVIYSSNGMHSVAVSYPHAQSFNNCR